MDEFKSLLNIIEKVPGVNKPISYGYQNNLWWVKFSINIEHCLAWIVIQEFGHLLNYMSVNDRLPVRFYPVSPPPYINGGPKDFLSWVIDSEDESFTPDLLKQWLEARLPDPIEKEEAWIS